MDCKKIFNIINIIFFIIFLSIIFTGKTFTCYNSIRNGITGSNYEINKDMFYISKNILTLPIIIIIYFFLNNTKINNTDCLNKDGFTRCSNKVSHKHPILYQQYRNNKNCECRNNNHNCENIWNNNTNRKLIYST